MEKNEHFSETVVAGKELVVWTLFAQWDRLEVNQGFLYSHWVDADTGAVSKQLVVPKSLVAEVLHASTWQSWWRPSWTVEDNCKVVFIGQDWERMLKIGVSVVKAVCKAPIPTRCAPLHPSWAGFPMERLVLDIFGPLSKHGVDFTPHWSSVTTSPVGWRLMGYLIKKCPQLPRLLLKSGSADLVNLTWYTLTRDATLSHACFQRFLLSPWNAEDQNYCLSPWIRWISGEVK